MSLDDTIAARALSALGHTDRLRIFRLLVRAGDEGLPVSDIGGHLGLAPSTLAHHLSALVQAGLVMQEKQGRQVINRAEFKRMQALQAYLSDECCAGVTRLSDETAA